MREKYESLALVQLRELAKVRGLKGTSGMKKAELVEAMLAEDERQKKPEEAESVAKTREVQQNADNGSGQGAYRRTGNGSRPSRFQRGENARTEGSNFRGENARTENSNPRGEAVRAENVQGENPRTENVRRDTYRQESPVKKENYRPEAAARGEDNQRTEPQRSEYQRPEAGTAASSEGTPAPRPNRINEVYDEKTYPRELDSGEEASGILEVMPDGYGFIRCENYLPGENDVYVAPSQIRRFGLKTGDILKGNKRIKTQQEKFSALLFIRSINGYTTEESAKRTAFEDMTPIFPNQRIRLETPGCSVAMRVMDLVSPVGKGQRGMIVSPPKAGKTTLLKDVAKSILRTNPHMHMLVLLIDERPEEVTDIKEAVVGENVEVIYSTFDELPEHHKRVSEMVIERAKRLVEHKKDVVILLDSITRLTRAYNLVVPPSGRTLSGGLDPAALHMPKRFFGAARNMREGGSLTILATALVDTGSKLDDVVYEEFKGTGNMEMVLDRRLSEKRIFPAIDLAKSGTRREDLLLNSEELDAINIMRKALNGLKPDEATDRILDMFARTRNNNEFVMMVKKNKFI
ncbi:MAG: transcription termination factor Rho [Acetatifactor sp.]|nr:transcription termination factor Rho [Acetatifactor sp.]